MKKIIMLFLLIAVSALFLLIFAPYTQNTELFSPKDIPGTDSNLNPDALKQISREKSEETLSVMQDFISLSETIILNIRYERVEDAYDDIEEYKNYLSKYDNLVINLDMTKSEIEKFRRNNKEHLKNLETLAKQNEELLKLEMLQIRYQNSDDMNSYYSVTYNITQLREEISGTKKDLAETTEKTIESGEKYSLQTESLNTSKKEIEFIGVLKREDDILAKPEGGGKSSLNTTHPKDSEMTGGGSDYEITSNPTEKTPTLQDTLESTIKPKTPHATTKISGQESGKDDVFLDYYPFKHLNLLIKNFLSIFSSDKKTEDSSDSFLLLATVLIVVLSFFGFVKIRRNKSKKKYKKRLTKDKPDKGEIGKKAGKKDKKAKNQNLTNIQDEYQRLISSSMEDKAFRLLADSLFGTVAHSQKIKYKKSLTNNDFLKLLPEKEKTRLLSFVMLYEKVVYSDNKTSEDKENLYLLFSTLYEIYEGGI